MSAKSFCVSVGRPAATTAIDIGTLSATGFVEAPHRISIPPIKPRPVKPAVERSMRYNMNANLAPRLKKASTLSPITPSAKLSKEREEDSLGDKNPAVAAKLKRAKDLATQQQADLCDERFALVQAAFHTAKARALECWNAGRMEECLERLDECISYNKNCDTLHRFRSKLHAHLGR